MLDSPFIEKLLEKVEDQSVKSVLNKLQIPIPGALSFEQREEAIAILEQMKIKNPAVAKLVNSMGLDPGTDNEPEDLPF